jgi:hypothetical protein
MSHLLIRCTVAVLVFLLSSSSSSFPNSGVTAFSPSSQRLTIVDTTKLFLSSPSPPGGSNGNTNIERLQFKIYPDGRIEETVYVLAYFLIKRGTFYEFQNWEWP